MLRYATMAGLDIAVVELDATYAELGVGPLVVTTAPDGAASEYAGVPVDGVPESERYLRRGTCTHQPPVTVAEHRWIWYGLLPNNCQGISGGASGSPVLRAGSREMIGTLNTLSEPSPAPLCAR